MNVAINNRFSVLLAEKRVKEKRNIPLTEVAGETGISYPTLLAWANNTVTRFDTPVIDRLCQYLSINPGDLFEYIEGDSIPLNKHKKKK